MDEQKQTEQNQNTANAQGGSQQNAQADLKQVADRAKAATAGFSFDKLFHGRLDEKNYLYAALAGIVLGSVLSMIPLIGFIVSIALFVIGVGVTVRRLHDIDMDGWIAILLIVPFVGLLLVIYLCWKQGMPGANRFGEAPSKNREFFKAVLNT
jgi:hypothetical protein